VTACGDDAPRQDAGEPAGEFEVDVVGSEFPVEQQLAKATELVLELENTGSDQVPNLVVTIFTGDRTGGGPFTVPSEQAGVSNPNRPVWILANGYPKVVVPGDAEIGEAPPGARSAQGKTFSFGPLDAGESREIVWRLTPVQAGAYTVHYEIAAGLNGKATAVDSDGGPVGGEFEATITDLPPRLEVDGSGQVKATAP
jgi:hypothetical protein